mgnify:CR=1 FL=1
MSNDDETNDLGPTFRFLAIFFIATAAIALGLIGGAIFLIRYLIGAH